MGVYTEKNRFMPKISKNSPFNGFYAEIVNINFPSGGKRPAFLAPTYGRGTREIANTNTRTIGFGRDAYQEYCYNIGTLKFILGDSGSDAGLMNNALANLSGGSIDLLVALMELPQTIEMVASAAEAAWRASKKFARGQLVDGLKELGKYEDMSRRLRGRVNSADRLKNRTLESSYLEAQFGWLPFFSDIKGGLAALDNHFAVGKQLSSQSSNVSLTNAQRKLERYNTAYDKEGKLANATSGHITISVWGEVENSELAALNSLGFVNALNGAWEITPYSFVVDYFVGVQDYLGALTSRAGLRRVYACKTTTVTHRGTSLDNGFDKYAQITFTRVPVFVSATLPSSKIAGWTQTKTANITALLAQRFRR